MAKARGINRSSKAGGLGPGQLDVAEKVLDEAFKHTQSKRPILALLCACLVESGMRNLSYGHSSSVGILQLLNIHLGGSMSTNGGRRDVALVTRMFLNRGFWGKGGAIAIAKRDKGMSVGQIAQQCQGSAFPGRYDQQRSRADSILKAYGGAGGGDGEDGGGGGSYTKQYNFQIGTTENPREDYWTGFNRLADEVNWALFLDGQELYFDSETTLIKFKPSAVIRRGDPTVIRFSTNWDGRQVATEAELVLICDPFAYRAGEVFQLEGFGPASTGSTVDLPGRWLIEEVDRSRFSPVSTFKLKQPEKPKKEPASEKVQREKDEATGEGGSGGSGSASINRVGGAKGIVDDAVRVVKEVGGSRILMCSGYRPGSSTSSGNSSDHSSNNSRQAARDIQVRGIDALVGPPHPKLDKGAVALAHEFQRGRTGKYRMPRAVVDTFNWKGYRIQIIWRTPAYGGHMGHIHIGCRKL